MLQVPYFCNDCETWHVTLYDIDSDTGERLMGDMDGDWETVDAFPTDDEIAVAWEDYTIYVSRTGDDPLDVIGVPTTTNVEYLAIVIEDIVGIKLESIFNFKTGKLYGVNDLPKETREYLSIIPSKAHEELTGEPDPNPDYYFSFADNLKDFVTAIKDRVRMVDGGKVPFKTGFHFDVDIPRDEADIKADKAREAGERLNRGVMFDKLLSNELEE